MNKELMCVLCPNSCYIKIEYDEATKEMVKISGSKCKRGLGFARQEITLPLRTLTFSVRVKSGDLPLVSTRSTKAIPLTELQSIAEQLKGICLTAPVRCGDVVYKSGSCEIVATKNISCLL